MNDFVVLSCPNCGAKLDVYTDIDLFGCSFCGTEVAVQRRGGTVGLKIVQEAISRVQIGTDKTAAELAIARYERELTELRNEEKVLTKKQESETTWGFGCGGLMLVFGFILASSAALGWWLLLIGLCGVVSGIISLTNGALDPVRCRIEGLEARIEEQRKIAER